MVLSFFALIRTSLDKGVSAGAYLALGVALSEIFAAAVVYSSLSQLQENAAFQQILGYVGGVVLMIFGLAPYIRPAARKKYLPHKPIKRSKNLRYIFAGILFNIMNPFVYIFWIGIVISIPITYTYSEVAVFLASIILTVFSIDLTKVYIANYITKFLTTRAINRIDKIAGIVLFGFGIRLFIFAMYGV